MTWTIAVPFRSRDEPLSAVGDAARALATGEDRAVARQLVLAAATDGVATVGELLDKLEQSGPASRRLLLDQARAAAGLPDTATVDARAQADAASRAGLQRPRPRLEIGPSGGFVDVADQDADAARAAAEADSRRQRREAKDAERTHDAAEHADHERARAEALRREFPDPMMFPG